MSALGPWRVGFLMWGNLYGAVASSELFVPWNIFTIMLIVGGMGVMIANGNLCIRHS